jgi:hypothetical protein
MRLNLATLEQNDLNQLPKEAMLVLELLEQIENHTANLRKDIISEMNANQSSIRLKLDQV